MSSTPLASLVARASLPARVERRLDSFEDFLLDKQNELCDALERVDGSDARFCRDYWERGSKSDGYGITRVLEGGDVFEKAAANVSIIRGTLTPERGAMSSRGRAEIDPEGGQEYEACALSLVFHPRSPMVPTFRADVRRSASAGRRGTAAGHLTPYYLFDEDAEEFHDKYRAVCDSHDKNAEASEVYAACKDWCDEYFYIRETRAPRRRRRLLRRPRGRRGFRLGQCSRARGDGRRIVHTRDRGRMVGFVPTHRG